jgi:propionyl-CoA carboxylase alpha chain
MIRKVLVANRGEIARRVMRTCRDLGIVTVAVHSDTDVGALFVTEADESVSIGGSTPAESYLRGDVIIAAALAAGVDAIHPGYGFLSENAQFARDCAFAGLTFIGPPVEAIELMGSKLAARELMERSGVPVLPGANLAGISGDEILAAADTVGWPILVKASFGGGGRGMRVVRARNGLVEAIAAARREAANAFGDDTVFLERYVDEPRHVEIQIFGDTHGTIVHLFERECSIQRRHQKIIEESPSPALSAELRRVMGDAAVAAGRAINYVGAGTVEFILAPGGEFFFLEVNTRLQVEHAVTEAVTGLDLVALQISVTEGEPLPPAATAPTLIGHAIEARLYAEDPLNDYLPVTGIVRTFDVPIRDGIRVDSGIGAGSEISVNYDPMLAKVIAYGRNRGEAIRKLSGALRQARIHGLTTNRELLVGILDHPEFGEGRYDTHFLDRHPPESFARGIDDPAELSLYAAAAALADQAQNRRDAKVWSAAPSGWRNNRSGLNTRTYITDSSSLHVAYGFGRQAEGFVHEAAESSAGARQSVVKVNDALLDDVMLGEITPESVELIVRGVRRCFMVTFNGTLVDVDSARGSVALTEQVRFPEAEVEVAPGSLVAPMPGIVVRVDVTEGDQVFAGQSLLLLEAMKMEHSVVAPADGVIKVIRVAVRETVDSGQVLVVIEEVE